MCAATRSRDCYSVAGFVKRTSYVAKWNKLFRCLPRGSEPEGREGAGGGAGQYWLYLSWMTSS